MAFPYLKGNLGNAPGGVGPYRGLSVSMSIEKRVDIIIYKIDDDSTRPSLRRRNLGQDNGYQVLAENIDNMQFRYQLNSGTWTDNPAGSESNIRAVQIFLVGRTAKPQRGYRDTVTYNFANNPITNPNDAFRRQVLSSTIKIRNLGL